MPRLQPLRDRPVQIRQMSCKKMIPAGYDRHLRIFPDLRRKLLDQCTQHFRRTKAVKFPGHQKLRLRAPIEICEAAALQISDRETETYELRHARILAPGTQADPRAKTESREEQRRAWKLFGKEIKHGHNVVLLSRAVVVPSFA